MDVGISLVGDDEEELQIEIKNLPKEVLIKKEKELVYNIHLENNRIDLNVSLKSILVDSLKGKNRLYEEPLFSIRKQKNNIYQIRIRISLDEIINKLNNNVVDFTRSSEILTVNGILKITKKEIKKLQKKYRKNRSRMYEKEKKKRILKERQENAKRMAEALSNFEANMKKKPKKNEEEVLRKKKIYLMNPNSRRRCSNCISHRKGKCMSHGVTTTKNHGCERFHTYKTFLGGGFSPK